MSTPPRTEPRSVSPPATEMSSSRIGLTFDEFYRDERDPLARSLSLIVGDPLVAAELIDEAMARAYQRWDRVRSLQRPGGWVYRVALNLSTSRFRRIRRDVKYRWLSTPPAAADETAESAFRAQIEDDRLLAALLDLPLTQRTVVVARILLDYSESEVAELTGVRPGTVKSRLSRGLDQLRSALPDLANELAASELAASELGSPPPPSTDDQCNAKPAQDTPIETAPHHAEGTNS